MSEDVLPPLLDRLSAKNPKRVRNNTDVALYVVHSGTGPKC
jgi:hypothetical protein